MQKMGIQEEESTTLVYNQSRKHV